MTTKAERTERYERALDQGIACASCTTTKDRAKLAAYTVAGQFLGDDEWHALEALRQELKRSLLRRHTCSDLYPVKTFEGVVV